MPTLQTQYRRRLKLIRHLEYIRDTEPERFDLHSWMSGDNIDEARTQWPKRLKQKKPLNCGTSACVVGHLPLIFPNCFKWAGNFVFCAKRNLIDYHSSEKFYLSQFFGGSDWDNIIFESNYPDPSNITIDDVLKRIYTLHKSLPRK